MFITRFIYDLFGRPIPTREELCDEIDRLLYIKSAEEPNYLVEVNSHDSEIIALWIKRKFEPALVQLLFSDENYSLTKSELLKMQGYKTHLDKLLRVRFVEKQANQRLREMCLDDSGNLNMTTAIEKLKRTLTYLSENLRQQGTLQNTDLYTVADVILYSYLKRILVGRYKDFGLKAHVRLCDQLIHFMTRYTTKNTYVINITQEDPLANNSEQKSLISEIVKPASFALAIMFFYLWRTSK